MHDHCIVAWWDDYIKDVDVSLLLSNHLGVSSAWFGRKLQNDMGRQEVGSCFEVNPLGLVEPEVVSSDVGITVKREPKERVAVIALFIGKIVLRVLGQSQGERVIIAVSQRILHVSSILLFNEVGLCNHDSHKHVVAVIKSSLLCLFREVLKINIVLASRNFELC
jgi:hypothetical protein